MIFPDTSYNHSWQLYLNESIPNGTNVTLTFEATILNCGMDGSWHDCPNSTLQHTFTVIWPDNEWNRTDTNPEPDLSQNLRP